MNVSKIINLREKENKRDYTNFEIKEECAIAYGTSYKIIAPLTSNNPIKIISRGRKYKVYWQPSDLWYEGDNGILDPIIGSIPASLSVLKNTISYERLFPNCVDTFIVEPNKVKHIVYLNEKPRNPASYLTGQVYLCISGFINIMHNGIKKFDIKPGIYQEISIDNKVVLPEIVIKDKNGNIYTGNYKIFPREGISQKIFLRIPIQVILNGTYPIEIDPTVEIRTDSDQLSDYSAQCNVKQLSDGTLVLIAHGYATDDNWVDVYVSKNKGATWSNAGYVTTDYEEIDSAIMDIDENDNIHIIAVAYKDESEGPNVDVQYFLGTFNSDRSSITWQCEDTLYSKKPGSDEYEVEANFVVHKDPYDNNGWLMHVVISQDWYDYSEDDYDLDILYGRFKISTSYTITTQKSISSISNTGIDDRIAEPPAIVLENDSLLGVYWGGWDNLYYIPITRSGNSWTVGSRVTITTDDARRISKAVIFQGTQVIAMYNYTDDGINVWVKTGSSSFTEITPSGISTSEHNRVDLTVGQDGKLYMFYFDTADDILHLRTYTYPGSWSNNGWSTERTIPITTSDGTTSEISYIHAFSFTGGIGCAVDDRASTAQVYIYYELFNNAPNPPSFFNIYSGRTTYNKRPRIYMTVSDIDNDQIDSIDIAIATNSSFTNIIVNTSNVTWHNSFPLSSGYTASFTPTIDIPPSSSPYYLRARIRDINGTWSSYSMINFYISEFPITETIPDDAVIFKADWLNKLSTAINNVREFRGLSTVTFTDGTLTNQHYMKAIHITERRQALEGALSKISITPIWTDYNLTNVDRKGIHIKELIDYCKKV